MLNSAQRYGSPVGILEDSYVNLELARRLPREIRISESTMGEGTVVIEKTARQTTRLSKLEFVGGPRLYRLKPELAQIKS
jgi:hypothetical protein